MTTWLSDDVTMSRPRAALLYAACWIPMALLYSVVLFVQADGYMSVGLALRAGLENAVAPAVMGLGIWWLTARVPVPENRFARFGLLHTALAALFGALWAGWEFCMMGEAGRARATDYVVWHMILPWQLVFGVLLYGLIAGISYALRGMLGSRDLRAAAERSERLRAQAELAALRAHISPHFLFNTLHSVTQLLRSEPARAESALERLSDLFRYTLRLDRQRVELVSLEEEWQFTASYLWLEQMRMGERLVVDAKLDDDALACAVPPFTLQPLVENAIKHGLGPKREGGTLVVRAREADGVLSLEVRDSGVGATAAQLGETAGLGVRSVRQRLEARHGSRARVDAEGRDGAGVTVRISIPAEPAP